MGEGTEFYIENSKGEIRWQCLEALEIHRHKMVVREIMYYIRHISKEKGDAKTSRR